MRNYPIPFNEEARLRAVHGVPGLTRDNEALFDTLCEAVRNLFGCRIAHISIVDEKVHWYKSVVGTYKLDIPKEYSFCTYTILSNQMLVVPDLSADPKFANHPMVEGGPKMRFYAGVPLVLSSGFKLGSLCGVDSEALPAPSAAQLAVLADLGRAVVAALERAPATEPSEPNDDGQSVFLTLVGHELRTPLTVIQGGLQILEARMEDGPQRRLAASAAKSSEHLANLIQSILKFSDVKTGELFLNEGPCDLGQLISEVATVHAINADGQDKSLKSAEILIDRAVIIDPEHIKLALTALMLNAVRHGGDEITLSAGLDADGNIAIDVTDNGNLDAHVELAELYKPFVVGGNIRNRGTHGGLGLGLPLTRKLVELHGGDFVVLPDENSTTARILLPRWRANS